MKQRSIDIDLPELSPGLVGLVEAVARLTDEDPQELLAISSAAFCNYAFEPAFNQHEDEPREFSSFSLLFSNYGPWESISYYTGWELREVNALDAVETLKVIVFELEHDRPVVTLTPDLEPTAITGHRITVAERLVRTPSGDFELRDDASLQGENGVFENWAMLVRPGGRAEWAATPIRQQISVLRWAAQHAGGTQEYFQETWENYAPGLAALARFREFLDGLSDPDGVRFAARYVRSLYAARTAAASSLRAWAEPIAAELDSELVQAKLLEAAGHYAAVAGALAEPANLSDAIGEASACEHAAVAALREAVAEFPAAFEA